MPAFEIQPDKRCAATTLVRRHDQNVANGTFHPLRCRGEVFNVGADQTGARAAETQPQATEDHVQLHHRWAGAAGWRRVLRLCRRRCSEAAACCRGPSLTYPVVSGSLRAVGAGGGGREHTSDISYGRGTGVLLLLEGGALTAPPRALPARSPRPHQPGEHVLHELHRAGADAHAAAARLLPV